MPERAVRGALRDLAQRSEAWLDDLTRLPFDAGQVRKLRRVILHRLDQLTRFGLVPIAFCKQRR